jgi:dolichol-phosphate mannosyltransferase
VVEIRADDERRALELAVVVPTFNERDNVRLLVEKLERALEGISHEVIFVDDDSPDGTANVVRSIGMYNSRVRVLQRVNRRGLAAACIEGMLATAAPCIAVMDADLQHDERILPQMLQMLKAESLDIVIATRNAIGGGMGEFAQRRVLLSNVGSSLSRFVSNARLSDPMSGFFVLQREYLEEVVRSASGIGFKILLDLVASSTRPVRIGEVPYTFGERIHGASKLDILVGLEYLELLLDKTVGDVIPTRFIVFGMVGSVGVVVALAGLYTGVKVFHLPFITAQAVGTFAAMTTNFFLNNSTTYRDCRLRDGSLWIGLLMFYVACSLGAVINVRVAEGLRAWGTRWYIAGAYGLVVGAVWNYGVTSFTTWRRWRRRRSAPVGLPCASRADALSVRPQQRCDL